MTIQDDTSTGAGTGNTTGTRGIEEHVTSDQDNPYFGRTLTTARPTLLHAESRLLSKEELAAKQARWDAAEQVRLQAIAALHARQAFLMRDEVCEEPASKALENRLRIAYLSTKGATMKLWLEEREAILANQSTTVPDWSRM